MVEHLLKGEVVTVDGPTASGKGTLAKRLAKRFKLKFLDTGTLYRAVAWQVLQSGGDCSDAVAAENAAKSLAAPGVFDFRHKGNNVFGIWISGREITDEVRTPEVSAGASVVAAIPQVRAALLDLQRGFVAEWKPVYGVVLDGRDTGARIAPEARLKLFLVADAKVRAQRRFEEYKAMGKQIVVEDTLRDLEARDLRDRPNTLRTDDAQVLDATGLNADEVEGAALALIKAVFGVEIA